MYGIKTPTPLRVITCQTCGKSVLLQLSGKPGGNNRKFCSRECQKAGVKHGNRVWRARQPKIGACKECGVLFTRKVTKQRFCSKPCCDNYNRRMADRLKESRRRSVKKYAKLHPEKVAAWQTKNRHMRRMATPRPGEAINPTDIFHRDKWRCQLCGCKVRKAGAQYRPNNATLDHIIPLARGGSHTYGNLQTACHLCNSKKHTKAIGQIRMF